MRLKNHIIKNSLRPLALIAGILFQLTAWNSLRAQDTDVSKDFNGIISSYPVNFFISSLKAGYEFKVKESLNLKLIGTVMSSGKSEYYLVDTVLAYAIEVQPRFYTYKFRNDFHGFYLAPFAAFNAASFSVEEWKPAVLYGYDTFEPVFYRKHVRAFSAGGVMGFQVVYNSHIGLDFYLGGRYNYCWGYKYSYFDQADQPFKGGIAPHAGFAICMGL